MIDPTKIATGLSEEPCDHCDDSGYVEVVHGGFWTGENLRTSQVICDCPCGDDVRREAQKRKVING